MNRLLFILAGVAGLALTGAARAGVEADPNKEYLITKDAGPWLVRAAVFVGPEAASLAHEMVLEIRSRYNAPAYVFNYGEQQRKEQRARLEEARKQMTGDYKVPLRVTRIEDQCAVLVGGYKDLDTASRAMREIKRWQPPTSERLSPEAHEIRPDPSDENRGILYKGRINPFSTSFVVHNPEVPIDRKPDPKANQFYKKLNANESLSLLKCRKPWTLVVATYQGQAVIQTDNTKESFFSELFEKTRGERLAATGQNAHNLGEALRTMKFDAYVLHTTWGSVVTIGGFDGKDDPKMQELKRTLTSNVQLGPSLHLLAEPMPMEVPRP
jgi:hypothetical protein